MNQLGEAKAKTFATRLYELACQDQDYRVALEAVKEGFKRLYLLEEDGDLGPFEEALRRIIEVKFVGAKKRDAGSSTT